MANKTQERPYISVEEMRTMLHLGKNYAYKLCKTEGFPCVRINGVYRIDKAAFEQWIKSNYGKTVEVE